MPARSESEIPRVAERVLRKIEGLSALTKNDSTVLPSDVVQAVFRALYLSREEKKAVLHYVSQAATATITMIRVYVETRFKQYELMANTLGPLNKHTDQKNSRFNNADILSGAAATADAEADGPGGGGERDEAQHDEEQYEDELEENGETKLKENERDEVSEPVDRTKHEPQPICLFCKKKGMTTDHWMSNCKKVKASSKTEIQ